MKLNKDLLNFIGSLTFFTFLWAFYNSVIRPKDLDKKHFMGGCVLDIPDKMKPAFPILDRKKQVVDEECLDKWSLGHFILYLVTGLVSPGHYKLVAGVSVFCEIFEHYSKQRAKMSDLYVNLLGYLVGTLFAKNYFKVTLPMKSEYVKYCVLIIIASGLVLINTRKKALANTKSESNSD